MEKKEPLRDWSPSEIRDAIKKKGVPIEELAELWGVSKGSLYNSMSGSNYWDHKVLIAEYLGIKLEIIWPVQAAIRQEKAERRTRSLLEAKALAARHMGLVA